jgi:hypothetical protein
MLIVYNYISDSKMFDLCCDSTIEKIINPWPLENFAMDLPSFEFGTVHSNLKGYQYIKSELSTLKSPSLV